MTKPAASLRASRKTGLTDRASSMMNICIHHTATGSFGRPFFEAPMNRLGFKSDPGLERRGLSWTFAPEFCNGNVSQNQRGRARLDYGPANVVEGSFVFAHAFEAHGGLNLPIVQPLTL
jgi:hypothetical protein